MVHIMTNALKKYQDAVPIISEIMKDKTIIIKKETRNLISKTFREQVIEYQSLIKFIDVYLKQHAKLPKLHPYKRFTDGINAYKYQVQTHL